MLHVALVTAFNDLPSAITRASRCWAARRRKGRSCCPSRMTSQRTTGVRCAHELATRQLFCRATLIVRDDWRSRHRANGDAAAGLLRDAMDRHDSSATKYLRSSGTSSSPCQSSRMGGDTKQDAMVDAADCTWEQRGHVGMFQLHKNTRVERCLQSGRSDSTPALEAEHTGPMTAPGRRRHDASQHRLKAKVPGRLRLFSALPYPTQESDDQVTAR